MTWIPLCESKYCPSVTTAPSRATHVNHWAFYDADRMYLCEPCVTLWRDRGRQHAWKYDRFLPIILVTPDDDPHDLLTHWEVAFHVFATTEPAALDPHGTGNNPHEFRPLVRDGQVVAGWQWTHVSSADGMVLAMTEAPVRMCTCGLEEHAHVAGRDGSGGTPSLPPGLIVVQTTA